MKAQRDRWGWVCEGGEVVCMSRLEGWLFAVRPNCNYGDSLPKRGIFLRRGGFSRFCSKD